MGMDLKQQGQSFQDFQATNRVHIGKKDGDQNDYFSYVPSNGYLLRNPQ